MLKSSWCRIWQICYFQNTHWLFWTSYISFLNSMSELGGTLEVIASHRYGNWGPERSDLFKVTVLWVFIYTCIYGEMVSQYFCKIKKSHKVFFQRWNRGCECTVMYCGSICSPNQIHFSWADHKGMKWKHKCTSLFLCELNKTNKKKQRKHGRSGSFL